MKYLAALCCTCVLSLLCCACSTQAVTPAEPAERNFFAMNTYITMEAAGADAGEALEQAETLVHQLEARLSVTDEDSELYAVNHSGGQPVAISKDTEALLTFALDMAEQTGGALDPTIYPVLTAWGFTTGERQVPAQAQLDELLPLVDHDNVLVSDGAVTLPAGMALDLGAVAKGYTGDRVAELLRERGITSALVSLGGNVQTIGGKPDGTSWRVGVRDPFSEGNLGVLSLRDEAAVTSGGYQNYFYGEDGRVYWHILDPETGYPARSGLASVTVIAPRGALCDALSTALFVMGLEDGLDYWRASREFEAVFVTEDQQIYLTSGLADRFAANADMAVEIVEP